MRIIRFGFEGMSLKCGAVKLRSNTYDIFAGQRWGESLIFLQFCETIRIVNLQGRFIIFLDSSMVEHAAVNRGVVGSSPTRGVRKSP